VRAAREVQLTASYKLLAVDLDGTLLQHDGTIHDADARAIQHLSELGIPVSIVTGRLFSGSREAARLAKIIGPIACVDGSHIADPVTGQEHLHHAIKGDRASALCDIVGAHGVASFLFAQDAIVHDAAGVPFSPYVRTWSSNILNVDRVTNHPFWEHARGVLGVVSVGPDLAISSMVSRIQRELGETASVVSFPVARYAGLSALVVRAAGTTKGTAIEFLARHHGCSTREVVVVGDWINDVPMFRVAGRSFAMGQAPDDVKQTATDRLAATATTGGGVAEAIERIWGS
jgi:hydroxymethylpyrimidine pyrophosphatase-like HAD family hydrolase